MVKIFSAISILMGTVIGAGVLGIPYVISKSGFTIGLLHLIIIGIIIGVISLYLGEIALRTKENHQLTGYVEKYLGKKGKNIMLFVLAFDICAALVAYLVGEGESISYLIFNTTEYAPMISIIFWLCLSALTYLGIRFLEKGESIGIIIITALTMGILITSWNKINFENLSTVNTSHFFTPIGVIIFAFLGFAAIPVLKKELGKEKKLMKKTIVLSYLFTFIIYALFAFAVVGLKGNSTPEIATFALGKIFVLLGILTMFTSYLALSIAIIDMLHLDFKVKRTKAWIMSSLIPLFILIGLNLTESGSFTKILNIGGLVSGGAISIMIILMIKKAKIKGDRKPEYNMPYSRILNLILIALILTGAIMQIVKYI